MKAINSFHFYREAGLHSFVASLTKNASKDGSTNQAL